MSNQEPNEQIKKTFNWDPIRVFIEMLQYYAKTIIVLVFIINSVALSLYGFGLISPNVQATSIMGAVAATFAAIVLFTFVHNGVKSQITNNKRKR